MAKYNTAEWRSGMKTPKPEKMPRNYGSEIGEAYMKMPRNYEGEDTMLMPADKYGKAVDQILGKSEGGKKGDYNEEPDTAPVKSKKDLALDMMKMGTAIMGAPKRVDKKAKGGMISSASKRADGCAQRGKTKGRMI